jgi:phosphoglycerate dehydrogenase-like enzyme
MPNIVLCYPIQKHQLEWIRAAVPADWQVINAGQDGIAEAILGADIFCGHAKVPVPWDRVTQQGRLKWIQSSAAGLDHCLTPEVIESDIVVSSCSGLFANQVAEQTLALLYGWFRQLPTFFRQKNECLFERQPTQDLHGKSIGIIGLGGNGRRIAELLAPLGNQILATDVFLDDCPDAISGLYPASDLHNVLSRVDVVILGVPLNQSTHHLINDAALSSMRQGSLLVNVARGQVVDEDALISALNRGHLAGAAIDVTEVEPLPETSPLWSMDNVIITPHVGAQSAHRVDDSTKLFCVNLKRWQESQAPWNQVDKNLGFPRPSHRIPLNDLRSSWQVLFG